MGGGGTAAARRSRRRHGAAALLALALCTRAAFAAPPATLGFVQSAYDTHLRRARPDLATRYGLPHAATRLMPVTEGSLAADRAVLAPLRDSLARVDRATLDPREAVAFDSLQARIEREWEPIERGAWAREPEAYLPLTVGAVLDVAMPKRVRPCERAHRAQQRLRLVPEVLRAAQVHLRAADAFDRERAVARWEAGMLELRTALPSLLEGCREPARMADFVEADTLALEAMARFVRYVRDDLAQSARSR